MKKAGYMLFVALLCFILSPVHIKAAVLPMLISEDVGNGYRYEFPGVGGFSSNTKENEKVSVAVITLDKGLEGRLYLEKKETEFQSGSPILEPGRYELRVFKTEEPKIYGSYKFEVENDYDLKGEKRDIKLVENPKMKVSYTEKDGYCYTLPNGKKFFTTVPIGGISNTRVLVKTGEGVNAYSIRKDGKLIRLKEPLSFYESGFYELILRSNELGFGGNESYKIILTFQILSDYKPYFKNYLIAPMGFVLDEIIADKAVEVPDNKKYMQLKRDGYYEVIFRGIDRPDIIYTCKFCRDTTPPRVVFSDEIKNKIISHPIKYSVLEADINLVLYKNFNTVHASNNLISQNGSYVLVASDEAGNESIYNFTIHKDLEIRPIVLLGAAFIIIFAAGVLLVYFRRKPNVR
ncbi:MAG: hypothetical protein ACTTKP_04000 [Catonella sp.]|uniref:hypothetical protein n=1 Tax=Catonella sp. TaxID=2382125 RepID=UPI003FA0FAE2